MATSRPRAFSFVWIVCRWWKKKLFIFISRWEWLRPTFFSAVVVVGVIKTPVHTVAIQSSKYRCDFWIKKGSEQKLTNLLDPPTPPSYPQKKELNRKKRSSVPLLKIWLVNCLLPNIFGAHNQISLAKKRIKIEKVRNSIKKCYFCLYSYLNKAKKTLLERTSFFHLVFTEPHL